MKKRTILALLCVLLFAGCSSVSQSRPSSSATLPSSASPSSSGASVDNVAPSLVGTWKNLSFSGSVFKSFEFGESGEATFCIGVRGGGYDMYFGTYSIEATALTATLERKGDGAGENLRATFFVETDVLTLTNIHEEPYNSPFVDDFAGEGSAGGLLAAPEISFERSELPFPSSFYAPNIDVIEQDNWHQHFFTLGAISAELRLPPGMTIETEGTPPHLEQLIVQNGAIIPTDILDVSDWELYYGNRVCRLLVEGEALLDVLRDVGPDGFKLEEHGLINETFTHSETLEDYTYCVWGDYIIYHYPSPGVGGPFPSLVYTHLPSGLTLKFDFSGDSVSDAAAYYSEIVATIQYL